MEVLVTGAGGFLGGAVAQALLRDGNCVRHFSRSSYPKLNELGIAQFQGDLLDPTAVDRAVNGCEAVFHVAAKVSTTGSYSAYHQTNVIGTCNVIDACRRHGVGYLIFTSSASVVFDGRDMEGVDERMPYPARYVSNYARSKAMAEQAIIYANGPRLRTITLRPHIVWGEGDRLFVPRILARARKGKLRRIRGAPKRIGLTHIEDAARAHLLAGKRLVECPDIGGRVFFISSEEPVYAFSAIDELLKAAHHPPIMRSVSPTTAYVAGALHEFFHWLLRRCDEPAMSRWMVRELATAHWFDISAAREAFAFESSVTLRDGLGRLFPPNHSY